MIQTPITITDAVTLSDGGTKYLIGTDTNGNDISLLIAQYVFPEYFNSNHIPGRLHLNEQPIVIRSEIENTIIDALKNCIISTDEINISYIETLEKIKNIEYLAEAHKIGVHYGIAYLIRDYFIDFITSNQYIEIDKKINIP